MRRLPNKYERCILYQGAKDEAFASPGEEYAAAFYWLSRIDWLDLDEAKVIAQQASERVIAGVVCGRGR
ncbi:TPA: hypothetical protein ACPTZR_005296, partial [Escherichia coli]